MEAQDIAQFVALSSKLTGDLVSYAGEVDRHEDHSADVRRLRVSAMALTAAIDAASRVMMPPPPAIIVPTPPPAPLATPPAPPAPPRPAQPAAAARRA